MDAYSTDCMSCRTTIDRSAEVKTPIDVRVHARLGEAEICCLGEPSTVVTDCKDGCKLLVIQRLNLRIPLSYEVTVQSCVSETTCAEDC